MRVVSGIQTTGNLHLGNYLGAIKQVGRDAGRMTGACSSSPISTRSAAPVAAGLANSTIEMAATLLACGIDPRDPVQPGARARACRAVLDPQGHRADGLAQPHDAVEGQGRQEPRGRSVGCSPIRCSRPPTCCSTRRRMSPVGEDQKQHLELARDIATKFNTDFGVELFTAARALHDQQGRAADHELRDGSAKMSKSDPSDMSPDQPDRRRRHDRAEDPQGEDRSGAIARRRAGDGCAVPTQLDK
jgi:tryptophanyl-tRNA synthetase